MSLNYLNCKQVTIIGKAVEDKDGAFVKKENGLMYLIDGLDEWDESIYGKTVKVTGIEKIRSIKKMSSDSLPYQERVGKIRIIKRAKWEVVKSSNP